MRMASFSLSMLCWPLLGILVNFFFHVFFSFLFSTRRSSETFSLPFCKKEAFRIGLSVLFSSKFPLLQDSLEVMDQQLNWISSFAIFSCSLFLDADFSSLWARRIRLFFPIFFSHLTRFLCCFLILSEERGLFIKIPPRGNPPVWRRRAKWGRSG